MNAESIRDHIQGEVVSNLGMKIPIDTVKYLWEVNKNINLKEYDKFIEMNLVIRPKNSYTRDSILKLFEKNLKNTLKLDENQNNLYIEKNNIRYLFNLRLTDLVYEIDEDDNYEIDTESLLENFETVEEIKIVLISELIKKENINDMYALLSQIEKNIISQILCNPPYFNIVIKSKINRRIKEKLKEFDNIMSEIRDDNSLCISNVNYDIIDRLKKINSWWFIPELI